MTRTRQKLTGGRRVASAMWRAPDDPQIHGALDGDARLLKAFDEYLAAPARYEPPWSVLITDPQAISPADHAAPPG